MAAAPGRAATRPLPQQTRRALYGRGGADARLLERIATSSAYGAPQTRLHMTPGESRAGGAGTAAASALGKNVAGEGDAILRWLLAVLVAVSAGLAVLAVRERRRPARLRARRDG